MKTFVDLTNRWTLCRVDVEAGRQKGSNLSRTFLWDSAWPAKHVQPLVPLAPDQSSIDVLLYMPFNNEYLLELA